MVNILLVEDDDDVAEYFADSLSGYKVTVAFGGVSALRLFETLNETENFVAIVTDIIMPGMDGVELAKRIRAISTIPIIGVTGIDSMTMEARLNSAENKGLFDIVLSKPISGDDLLAEVERFREAIRARTGTA